MIICDDSTCGKCSYGTVDDKNPAKIIIHCDYSDKDRCYGQCIQCEHFREKENEKI